MSLSIPCKKKVAKKAAKLVAGARRIAVARRQTSTLVTTLRKQDIICAKGEKSNRWPGNKVFRKVVQDRVVEYKTSEAPRRKEIVREIWQKIQQLSSPPPRFLKEIKDEKNAKTWHEVTEEKKILYRISQRLRDTKMDETDVLDSFPLFQGLGF